LEEVSFGEWLKRRRKALDLTQEQLAQQISCSTSTLRKIEAEERRPSEQIVQQLAAVFNIPSNERATFLKFARGKLEAAPVGGIEDAPWHAPKLYKREDLSKPKIHLATFLFTDIEGSTKLWESSPEKMKMALQRHHAILQNAISSNDGEVFQTIGDAFCAAFSSAPSAISAALMAQRELYQEPWDLPFPIRVRMGIHTGEAERAASGYASNPTMNRVSRILNAAHGGQVLLSLVTRELLKDALPANTELRNMGEHYLKNLARPEHLFQLNIAGLPFDFPPLNSLSFPRHNLPVQLTSFIGREKEIIDVMRLLEKARMVTLIGSGGTGKTRLAVEVANELLDQFPDGVWFVELAPILDAQLVPRTTAIAIGLREEPQHPIMDILCNYLRDKHLLLILDNCEHLVDASAQLADKLLHAGSQIRVLATSREILGMAGELSYLVPSLKLPDMQILPTVESLSQCEAVRLFVERASEKTQRFTITDENAVSIAQICLRLDGIPLAIELAAGKILSLSAGQIAQRLDDRFRLLTSGNRTALPRHQTLRAAIEWSYHLLPTVEQTLFRRLSVFLNGWTLEAAEVVCSDKDTTTENALKKEDILVLLDQLVNKSLVTTEERHAEIRFRMLETIRQFGTDKLFEAREDEVLRDQHLDFFIQFAETADPLLRSAAEIEWLGRLDDEHDNLHSALEWAARKGSAEPALRLAGALATYWTTRSFWLEGSKWLERALEKVPLEIEELQKREKAARAKVLYKDEVSVHKLYDLQRRRAHWHSRLGFVYFGLGSLPESKKHVQEALRLLGYPFPQSSPQLMFGFFPQILQQMLHRFFPPRFLGKRSDGMKKDAAIEVARLYELMGKIFFHTGEALPIIYTVLRFLNEAENAGTSPELASAYASMAILVGFMRLHSLTETYVDRSIVVAEEVNRPSNLVTVSVITCVYKITVGKWEEVRAHIEAAKNICEGLGDYGQWGDCAVLLGESAFIAGDIQYAMNVFKELLESSRRRGQNITHQSWGLIGIAINNIRLGNPAAAVPMLKEVLQILQEIPNSNPVSSIEANGQLALAYLRLGEEENAHACADKVLAVAATISPTVYSLDIGFAATADVYFELWEKSLQNPSQHLELDKYQLSGEKTLKLLRAYQKAFPIGQPITDYYQGWHKWLMGKPQVAIRSWNKGLKAATKFNMPYEEGLIRLKLGSYLEGDQNERREHLECAIQIFEKMDALHELNVAKDATKKAGF